MPGLLALVKSGTFSSTPGMHTPVRAGYASASLLPLHTPVNGMPCRACWSHLSTRLSQGHAHSALQLTCAYSCLAMLAHWEEASAIHSGLELPTAQGSSPAASAFA